MTAQAKLSSPADKRAGEENGPGAAWDRANLAPWPSPWEGVSRPLERAIWQTGPFRQSDNVIRGGSLGPQGQLGLRRGWGRQH